MELVTMVANKIAQMIVRDMTCLLWKETQENSDWRCFKYFSF